MAVVFVAGMIVQFKIRAKDIAEDNDNPTKYQNLESKGKSHDES